jgi:hypothetical protein
MLYYFTCQNHSRLRNQLRFSDNIIRWLLFLAIVLGTVMAGTGLVSWAVKDGKQQSGRLGFALNRGLNIGSIARIGRASGAYAWVSSSQHILLIARCGKSGPFLPSGLLVILLGLFGAITKAGWFS